MPDPEPHGVRPPESSSAAPAAGIAPAPSRTPASIWSPTGLSRLARLLATILVFASFLLMSPPRGETYPGAKPWSNFSLLKPLTDLLSLNGLLSTERGVEIKDFTFHLAAAAGLALLAARLATAARGPARPSLSIRRLVNEPWLAAQLLLVAWVIISGLSAYWSGDRDLSYGQTLLYALALAWAISLAWTLEPPDVPKLLAAIVAASSAGAILCIWYYYERNPYHRPGFPVGNPITLAAVIAPAILICVSALITAAEEIFRGRRLTTPLVPLAAVAALVPLGWCFILADSRSAAVGLLGGVVVIALLRVGARFRWAVVGLAMSGAVAGGLWLMQYSRLDAAMGRSATVRFRLYAWHYAAELWDRNWLTAIVGNGAGSYPRLASEHSLNDRRLDPNAFMGDMVEHAHNELFEVLSEIGLVGGVTFVGGFLATLVAGGLLLRREPRAGHHWLHAGLLAAVVALMIDASFSSGMRLSVVPAIFFTLVGTLWALCRAASAPAPPATSSSTASAGAIPAWSAGALAICAAFFAAQNWSGVLHEERGRQAAVLGNYDDAYEHRATAEARILDPVRALIDDAHATRALLNGAVTAAQEAAADRQTPQSPAGAATSSAPATQPLASLHADAIERAVVAYERAVRLGRRAPTILGAASLEAGAAQLLSELYTGVNADSAAEWARRAAQGWLSQRTHRPYDFQALIMLTTYRCPARENLALLCDALRAPDARTLAGQPMSYDQIRRTWRDALGKLVAREDFAEELEQKLANAGPLNPQSDVDTLIATRAPEVYRIAAFAAAQQGDFKSAQGYAAWAVALYEPMRARFPTLSSAALLDQAEFALLETPANGAHAAGLLNKAIARLPVIQEQKQQAMLEPYQNLLAMALLAQGRETDAAAVLRSDGDEELRASLANSYVELARLYLRQPRDRRPNIEPWLAAALANQPDHLYAWSWRAWLAAESGDREAVNAILSSAIAAGVSQNNAAHIRSSLCREFPGFCDNRSENR